MQNNMDSCDTKILGGWGGGERNSACLGLYNENTALLWPLQTDPTLCGHNTGN